MYQRQSLPYLFYHHGKEQVFFFCLPVSAVPPEPRRTFLLLPRDGKADGTIFYAFALGFVLCRAYRFAYAVLPEKAYEMAENGEFLFSCILVKVKCGCFYTQQRGSFAYKRRRYENVQCRYTINYYRFRQHDGDHNKPEVGVTTICV
ncbi:hypothetical protein NPIL_19371 [Nephila pilipes]|uniref:Uncharacterized protein n=1 Tax=Nephila pilipes TaxID=299642 RepID=A0A8X6N7M6_NEPPI|nr:hypothetical protein NPIL_19371 [Nephila pilipes]